MRKETEIFEDEINNLKKAVQYINNNYIGKKFSLAEVLTKYNVYSRTFTVEALSIYLKDNIILRKTGTLIKNKISEEPFFIRQVLKEAKKLGSEYYKIYKKEKAKLNKNEDEDEDENITYKKAGSDYNELDIISYQGIKLIEATIHLGGYEINGTFTLKSLNNEKKD